MKHVLSEQQESGANSPYPMWWVEASLLGSPGKAEHSRAGPQNWFLSSWKREVWQECLIQCLEWPTKEGWALL